MSVSPDEGMMLLQQRMHASQVTSEAEPIDMDRGVEVGGELGLMVRLAAAVEANTAEMRASRLKSIFEWEQCHPTTLPGAQTNAANTIDVPDLYGPRQGWAWQVIGMALTLGSGATSFSIWEDASGDPTNLAFSSTVSGRWEPDDYFLMPGSRLVFTSVAGGLTVGKIKVVEIALNALPGYLGLRLAGRI